MPRLQLHLLLLHRFLRLFPAPVSSQIIPLTTAACNAVQLAIGHTFTNTNSLVEALDTTGMRTAESNQRLAMLGDALLRLVLLDSWYAGGTAKGWIRQAPPNIPSG